MKPSPTTFTSKSLLAISAGTSIAFTLLAGPALAATPDRGLFGVQDPSYDGVYRQGLAITGLVADRDRVPKRAVRWLEAQQCGNGGFTAYRSDTSEPCPKSDPATFSGPDTNSTASAAMALRAVGKTKEARAARGWLRRRQNTDGGFAYYRGSTSDANSTALALAALQPFRNTAKRKAQRKAAIKYLRKAQLRCEAPESERGKLSYVVSPRVANSLASAQGATGIVGTLPADQSRRSRTIPDLVCSEDSDRRTPIKNISVKDAVLGALARTIKANGGLPNDFGSGLDLTATTQAATALATANRTPARVRKATRTLRREAGSYTVIDGSAAPGALGLLLNLTGVRGLDSNDFGGVDLSRELLRSMR